MMSYLSSSFMVGWVEDQSKTDAVTRLPLRSASAEFDFMLCCRLGTIAGRSVRWMSAENNAEAVRPTRPVPAPSSRTLGWVSLGVDETRGGSLARRSRSSSICAVGGRYLVQPQEK